MENLEKVLEGLYNAINAHVNDAKTINDGLGEGIKLLKEEQRVREKKLKEEEVQLVEIQRQVRELEEQCSKEETTLGALKKSVKTLQAVPVEMSKNTQEMFETAQKMMKLGKDASTPSRIDFKRSVDNRKPAIVSKTVSRSKPALASAASLLKQNSGRNLLKQNQTQSKKRTTSIPRNTSSLQDMRVSPKMAILEAQSKLGALPGVTYRTSGIPGVIAIEARAKQESVLQKAIDDNNRRVREKEEKEKKEQEKKEAEEKKKADEIDKKRKNDVLQSAGETAEAGESKCDVFRRPKKPRISNRFPIYIPVKVGLKDVDVVAHQLDCKISMNRIGNAPQLRFYYPNKQEKKFTGLTLLGDPKHLAAVQQYVQDIKRR
uniref:Uncharacterized protein n=1 Tax=Mucochytrium quahogii TaxID=96639 RepID=A0A7S2SPA8_9STRA|mmetsp:Transcript_13234/g.23728  ORF Transcript_13234/g.23728 Transcript_13234/m.23728 type:complete len:375 (+) Transcript_13234:265-1389(+)|eukprot:CAMPEP_0203750458 /NCGR_PEP_ID=MMETSP0098-20131031/4680_1 /ASSEMBLY_ACC=CAM_ASM_000208 /TAXON_ID=96639 /ORGANISM=" , Strain NY0313808BC1" /LENGTH=374 /DNA_ID=CAMNT_0050639753 /DNA_START=229 /DNA_END=1353 /DNA_ORIENTATION=-